MYRLAASKLAEIGRSGSRALAPYHLEPRTAIERLCRLHVSRYTNRRTGGLKRATFSFLSNTGGCITTISAAAPFIHAFTLRPEYIGLEESPLHLLNFI